MIFELKQNKNILPKVKFVFDAEKELEAIKIFVNEFNEKSFLPKDILIFLEKGEDTKIIEFLNNSYKKEILNKFEKEWLGIEKEYFKAIEKVTGYYWSHKEYIVFVTYLIKGFCNPIDSNIDYVFVAQDLDSSGINYVIAHELFHSHYFNIVENTDDSLFYTEYNENTAIFCLLFTEVKKLFPGFDEDIIKSCINSHPGAAKYFDQMFDVWEKRIDFKDYLERVVKEVKIYKE